MASSKGLTNENVGKVHVPWGEDGSGKYSLATKGCFDVIANCKDLLMQAVKDVTLPPKGKPFVIADYGTADGGTSMAVLREVIIALRKRDPGREVHVWYEDQPNNDFKSLFFFTQGIRKLDNGVKALLDGLDNVYVSACGTGFHSQCFPTGTVHLGFCATAMHWLSKQPGTLDPAKGHFHHTGCKNGALTAPFAEQAEADWEKIMTARARELAPGGRFVIANFCVDSEGHFLGNCQTPKSMYCEKLACWRELCAEGKITAAERDACTFLNYYRTEEEHSKPFKKGGAVAALGLSIVRAEERVVPCPYRASWIASGKKAGTKEALKYAEGFVPTTRTWSNSTYTTPLISAGRTPAQAGAIVDDMFKRYAKRVAAAPADHGMDYAHWYAIMAKKGSKSSTAGKPTRGASKARKPMAKKKK